MSDKAAAASPKPSATDAVFEELKGLIVPQRPDMSLRDYAAQLLSFGAHVEHALMVQYLYAAYSLRAEREQDRVRIERWRSILLNVAREEMGHLLTVQNILTLIGAPTEFGRDSSQWAQRFYPFPFRLEPFSRNVLVRFIFAEMPPEGLTKVEKNIVELARPRDRRRKTYAAFDARELNAEIVRDIEAQRLDENGHRVGLTYAAIMTLLSDPRIPDSSFDEASYERQASADEWSRNYRPRPAQLKPEGDRVDPRPGAIRKLPPPSAREAYVQVRRVATRSDAVEALRQLSEQGEAPHLGLNQLDEPSHYERFVDIYRELREIEVREPNAPPASRAVSNPTTRIDFAKAQSPDGLTYTYIEAGRAHFLAQIFNQRYRLLLNYLAHSFRMARPGRFDQPNLRSMIMHRAFAEMYNLKSLAGLLAELPISELGGEKRLAAPPFELPPSLALPARETDVWRGHRDLILTSGDSMRRFLKPEDYKLPEYASAKIEGTAAQAFVRTLLQIDAATVRWIDAILAGVHVREANF